MRIIGAPHQHNTPQVCVRVAKPPPPLDLKRGKDGWTLFKQNWTSYCLKTRQKDEDEACKKALFLHTLGKEGLALYNSMQLPADSSVNKIIASFDIHFFEKSRNNETYERYLFYTQNQKEDETVDDYIVALCTLASTCNFCDCLKDSLLRDRIVLGIKDSSTRKRLLQEADLNLETCISMCRSADITSLSQPVKTETWTEDTPVVEEPEPCSVSPEDQEPGKTQDFFMNLRHHDKTSASPDEAEMSEINDGPDEAETSEVNVNADMDDSDDLWTPECQNSDVPSKRTERNENAMKEETCYFRLHASSLTSYHCPYTSDTPVSRCGLERMRKVIESSRARGDELHKELEQLLSTTDDAFIRCNRGCVSMYASLPLTNRYLKHKHMLKPAWGVSASHVCRRCSATFALVSSLELHLASVHGEKLCVVLPGSSAHGRPARGAGTSKTRTVKKVQGRSKRKIKRKKTDDSDGNGDKDGKSDREQHVCGGCKQSFLRAITVARHEMYGCRVKYLECDVCGKSFSKLCLLKRHRKIHRDAKPFDWEGDSNGETAEMSADDAGGKDENDSSRPHKCRSCGLSFVRYGTVKRHEIFGCEFKKFRRKTMVCDVCGESFTKIFEFKRHLKTHLGPKPFACEVCSKRYSKVSDLTVHTRTHTGEKPFKCPQCESGFHKKCRLKYHLQSVHADVREHLCDVCGAAFNHKGDLMKHKKRHMGVKPFVCPVCGRGFFEASVLKQHRMTHTGERPHVCQKCGKAFTHMCTLREHMMSHSDERPHICHLCLSTFKTKGNLRTHVKLKHNNRPLKYKDPSADSSVSKIFRITPNKRPLKLKDPSANSSVSEITPNNRPLELKDPSVSGITPNNRPLKLKDPSVSEITPNNRPLELKDPSVSVIIPNNRPLELKDPSVSEITPNNRPLELKDPSVSEITPNNRPLEFNDPSVDFSVSGIAPPPPRPISFPPFRSTLSSALKRYHPNKN